MATIQTIDNELAVTVRPKLNANFQALKTEVEAATAAIAGKETAGAASTAVADHVAAPDPHPSYALEADVTSALAGKAGLAGATFTGPVTVPLLAEGTTALGSIANAGTIALTNATVDFTATMSGTAATVALPSTPPGTKRRLLLTMGTSGAKTLNFPSLWRIDSPGAGNVTSITFATSTTMALVVFQCTTGGPFFAVSCIGDEPAIPSSSLADFFHDNSLALATASNIASALSIVNWVNSQLDGLQVPHGNVSQVPANSLLGNSTGSTASAEPIGVGSGISIAGGLISATGTSEDDFLEITGTEIDWDLSTNFKDTVSANTTYTFANNVSGRRRRVVITTTGNYTITWPAGSVGSGVSVAHTSTSTAFYEITQVGSAFIVHRDENGLVIDTAPPVVTSITINTAGTQATVNLDKDATVTDGSGFTMSATNGGVTPTYASGTGTSALVLTLSRTIYAGETVTLSYDGSGGIVGEANAVALADFTGTAVTNNSTASQYYSKYDDASSSTADPANLISKSGTTAFGVSTSGHFTNAGSYCFSTDGSVIWKFEASETNRNAVWIYLRFKGAESSSTFLDLRNASGVVQARIDFRLDRIYREHGSVAASALTTTTANADCAMWIYYEAESGAGGNGILRIYYVDANATTTRPTADIGTAITTGTGDPVSRIAIQTPGAGTYYIGRLRIGPNDIGDNPA